MLRVLSVFTGSEGDFFVGSREVMRVVNPISPAVKAEIDQILEAIIYLYTESRRITKEVARRANLTGPQLTVVKLLEHLGSLSLTELSEKIRSQNSTVTGIIDRMEREGLVSRARSQEDRRVVHIHLTDKGAQLALEVAVEPMEIFRAAIEDLTPTETKELMKILTKIAKRVQRAVATATERSVKPTDSKSKEPTS
jgi:DNA-binding MarR family transcriptional regulator